MSPFLAILYEAVAQAARFHQGFQHVAGHRHARK